MSTHPEQCAGGTAGVQKHSKKDHISLYPGKKNLTGEVIDPRSRVNPGPYHLRDRLRRPVGVD
jgi:hypothetical protein